MLAQAQAVLYIKGREDACTPGALEKLAAECHALYREATAASSRAHGQPYAMLSREWLAIISSNEALYHGLAQFHAAQVHASAREYGMQCSRLAEAASQCAAAVAQASCAPPATQEHFRAVHAAVNAAYANALKDNEMVYAEPMLPIDTLASPKRPARRIVRPTLPAELEAAASLLSPLTSPIGSSATHTGHPFGMS